MTKEDPMSTRETDPVMLFWLGVIDAASLVRRLRRVS